MRVNENPAVQALYTLFVKEHNRQAREIASLDSQLTPSQVFEEARKRVIAIYQKITMYDFLPAVLNEPVPAYTSWNSALDSSIDAFFAGASFPALILSASNQYLWLLDAQGQPMDEGPLLLRDNFWNPQALSTFGVEPVLRGLLMHYSQDGKCCLLFQV